jgi:SSS family solute:Na+ symporter
MLLLLFTLILIPLSLSVTPSILNSYIGTTPLLDGILDLTEWSDATLFGTNISLFDAQFDPVTDYLDLSITSYVKHDQTRLYFGFNVSDNLLYYYQTSHWLPSANSFAENLTRSGFPWFGDEMEILINAPNTYTSPFDGVTGTPGVFQMVFNIHKSRLFGMGIGGILEGEPRSSDTAWNNYQDWIYSRAIECAVHIFPQESDGTNRYGMEWAIDFTPLLQTSHGVYYNTSQGIVEIGLNIALGDVDTEAQGSIYGLRHEMWYSGNTSCFNHGNCHTLLSYFGTLALHPTKQ